MRSQCSSMLSQSAIGGASSSSSSSPLSVATLQVRVRGHPSSVPPRPRRSRVCPPASSARPPCPLTWRPPLATSRSRCSDGRSRWTRRQSRAPSRLLVGSRAASGSPFAPGRVAVVVVVVVVVVVRGGIEEPVNARSEEMSATVRSHARSRPRREACPATEARRHPDDDAPESAVGTLRAMSFAACSSSGTGAGAAFPRAADRFLRAALLRAAIRLQLRTMRRGVVVGEELRRGNDLA